MKPNFKILAVLFALIISPLLFPKAVVAQQDYVSLQIFYDELSPYGQWVDYPKYGYVWIPDAGANFVPYSTRGQWIYTDYGWTWVSDYEWGWAPFHYGRWDYDAYYGWLWVPDYDWGPSWVTWRRASGYYGWQPMRPGININLSFGKDYYDNYNDNWMFVRDRDFQRPNVSSYYVSQTKRDRIIRSSTVINNTYIDNGRNTTYISGPNREEVQRLTGRNIHSVAIHENTRPGQDLKDGQLRIYRPQVRNTNDQGRKPTPNKITNSEDIRPQSSYRNENNRQRNASPANDNRREILQNGVKQQNNDQIEQPTRQRMNENSPNNKREQQQNQAIPRNNDDNKTKQDVVPIENKGKEWQQDVVTPQNNKMKDQPTRQGVQQTEPGKQELQQKTATPPNNKKNNRQSREAKAKNNKR
jgi:hypothetical protein